VHGRGMAKSNDQVKEGWKRIEKDDSQGEEDARFL
jgi:hypothetical protein